MLTKRLGRWMAAAAALAVTVSMASGAPGPELRKFRETWESKKATNLDRKDAIESLNKADKEAFQDYLKILESDVWQFRTQMLVSLLAEANTEMLGMYEEFLFNEKLASKQPAAAEHVLYGLYNNKNWVKPEKYTRGAEIVKSKLQARKVKYRMIRELGTFRWADPQKIDVKNVDAQNLARNNVRALVPLLEAATTEKKPDKELVWMLSDALESLTGEEHGADAAKWRFFADGMKDDTLLSPRQGHTFKDALAEIDLEGQTFARKSPRKAGDMEILILPDMGNTSQYWFPYIFELNKTFACTFVELPDTSRIKDLEYLSKADGSKDDNAYYYPLAQLVEQFEGRRDASGKKKVGLIAHGVSGWIALEYLRLYPQSVEFAIIVQTWSGALSREAARSAIKNNREKDEAFSNFGESLIYDPSGIQGFQSLNESQRFWADTGRYKRRMADPTALETILFSQDGWRKKPESGKAVIVPQYEFANANRGKKIDVPVMMAYGARDLMFADKDETEYKKVFTKLKWVEFKDSSDTPWAEEPMAFFDAFNALLKDNKILERIEKEGNKKDGKK